MLHYQTNHSYIDSILKLFVAFSFIVFSHSALSQKTIVLNTAFAPPVSNDTQTGFGDQVLSEAFKRIGYQLETVRLPAERALINANRGIDDGELARVGGLHKKYPNLIQVPEPFLTVDMVLYTKNYPNFTVTGWNSVASYSLAIISGWKIMEKNFGELGDSVELIKTDNAEQSFALLENDRVDFIAYSNWSGLAYMKAHNITNVTLLKPPLASPKFYVYLHKEHKKIVPQLTEAIQQMKTDGTLQDMYNRLLKPYLPGDNETQEP